MLTHLVRNAGRGRRSAMVAAGRLKRVGYSHHMSLPQVDPELRGHVGVTGPDFG